MIASNDLDKSIQNIYTYIRSRPYVLRIYSIITLYVSYNSHKIVYKKDQLKIK
jgi:hypothetical protein